MIHNRDELKECRQKAKADMETAACRILVCSGTGCIATGSEKIYNRFLKLANITPGVSVIFAPHDEDTHIGLKKTGCQGFCELGPLVRITKNDETVQYVKVQLDDCQELFERAVLGDEVVERLLYRKEKKVYRHPKEIPFIAKQTRIVLENCGRFDAESIDEYMASGGFSALEKAMFEMTSEEVIEEIDKSGLRGRGGGGFPTGRKWKQVAHQKEKVRYVVCNGDEGDPGAFMDGSVMEGDPYKLLEGMMIAGYAVGAANGYIYVRAEYPMSVSRLRHAIAEMENRNLLGDNILGTDFCFHMHINRGAGAFVCGEGSALTASIEGKRGMPRVKPPRTVEKGLWEKPTVLNNVETFANVPKIILQGADWYRSIGTAGSPGTKTFSLTGAIENTGLIEVPMGTTINEIVNEIGGGVPNGKKLKAVQTGGPSGGVIPLEKEFVRAMVNIAKEKDILLIADEVQCGNGRSGKLYAYMNYGFTPDIVSTAKGLCGGLPLGATMLGEKVGNVFTPSSHGSTFGGNPVCCAGALNVLSRLDDTLLEDVRKKSEYIFNELDGAAGVESVAGLGLMIGVKMKRPAKDVVTECMKNGVLVLTAKDKVRLLPALNIPFELLEKSIDILKKVCAEEKE